MVKPLIWKEASLDLLCSIYRLRLANNLQDIQFGRVLIFVSLQGYPPLVSWLKDLQKQIHQPAPNTELVITTGSQDGKNLLQST